MNNDNLHSVNRLQGAKEKNTVRESLFNQMKPAILKMKEVNMLTLAGSSFAIEMKIIAFCKKHHKKYSITSLEHKQENYQEALQAKPKDANVKVIFGDFNKHLLLNFEKYNLVFADYMDGWESFQGHISLTYLTFFAQQSKQKALYYVTFSTNGRFHSRKGKSIIGYTQLLKYRIAQELKTFNHVQPILQINYQNKGMITPMVVLGFAINFGNSNDWQDYNDKNEFLPNAAFFASPMKNYLEPFRTFKGIHHSFLPFEPLTLNLLKEQEKSVIIIKKANTSKKNINDEIRNFISKGIPNWKIAETFNISQRIVGGLAAHVLKPNSFPKRKTV